jgi:hypothetical protein
MKQTEHQLMTETLIGKILMLALKLKTVCKYLHDARRIQMGQPVALASQRASYTHRMVQRA